MNKMAQIEAQVPACLMPYADERRWVLWKYGAPRKDGKRPKIPHQTNGRCASTINPQTWSTLAEVQAAFLTGGYAGIGINMRGLQGVVGIDLDGMRNPKTGQPSNEASAQLLACGSYVEVSPSGRGYRIFGRANLIKGTQAKASDGSGFEIYGSEDARYLTITGQRVESAPDALGDVTPVIERLQSYAAIKAANASAAALGGPPIALPSAAAASIAEEANGAAGPLQELLGPELLHRLACSMTGNRSADFQGIVNSLFNARYTIDEAEAAFRAHPEGPAAKWLENGRDDLRRELERSWAKAADRYSVPQVVGASGLTFAPISSEEWSAARIAPRCVVENYLYADVAALIAPGGVGKTTTVLYEATHIALGWSLYGNKVMSPGPVCILTAEDDREMLVARLRSLCSALDMTDEQLDLVRRRVLIRYVGGEDFRLCAVSRDMVTVSPQVGELVEALRPLAPVLVIVDPAVSFGVGEQRVNDAEQGLIQACRKIRDTLGCCVRLVHHTGKANAREQKVDQYAGRGGSAMADGARMVHVLTSLTPEQWQKETGRQLGPEMSGLRITPAKLSYCPPQPLIYVERSGYSYEQVEAGSRVAYQLTDAQVAAVQAEVREGWESAKERRPQKDVQGAHWVGHILSAVLGLDTGRGIKKADLTPEQAAARDMIKPYVSEMLRAGALIECQENNDKGRLTTYLNMPV